MALNDGYAVDAQGRRIYFPPIGQPRLVSSWEGEARFNGLVHTYGLITFGVFILGLFGFLILSAKDIFDFNANTLVLLLMVLLLAVRLAAASLQAWRWPALNDRNYTYHRFVVSTLSRQSTAWLRCKLMASGALAIGLLVLTGLAVAKLHAEWTITASSKNAQRAMVIPLMLVFVPFCAVYAYRVAAALRKQAARRALSA